MTPRSIPIRTIRISIALLTAAGLVLAQNPAPPPPADQNQTPHAWRSVNDGLPADIDQAGQPGPGDQNQAPSSVNAAPEPQQNAPGQRYPAPNQPAPSQQQPYYNPPATQTYPAPAGNYGVPPRLTIRQGTYITVRTNQWLSSDRNQKGDTFTATLEQPVVVDGFVVAQRGQTVYGRVTEAQKAGRVEGTSRLGVELTQLTLVDGDQISVQSPMINRNGGTSVGRDAAAVGTTTAIGSVIGAAADWGRGAAIGAGVGAAAGILGVLLTRGQPSVIHPESVLTFQVQVPVDIATDKAPQAFQYVNTQQDYQNNRYSQRPPTYAAAPPPPAPAPGYVYGPGYYPPYAYGYPYPYVGFGVVVGRGFYGPRYYRGGFYRR